MDISFGNLVRGNRRSIGLTQVELAGRVGCAAITVRKIEADALRPSVQIAERLAMTLKIPLDERVNFVRLARTASLKTPSPLPTPIPPPTPEEIGEADLSGRAVHGYQLGERIGSGGFGVIYRAVQPVVEREVAVKIILPQYANHPEFIRRFEAEAKLVARLEHPHIVPLYDYWREPDAAYLVMRLLRGGSLRERLKDGPLELHIFLQVLEQVSAALHAAHRFGVIHRDLKPDNILFDDHENAYLADFGVAKNLGDLDLEAQTQIGALVGSPVYASPEQIHSEPVRPQTDVYCLGLLIFEMLSGRQPFLGPTPIDYIMQNLNQTLLPLSEQYPALPSGLDSVIQRATAKEAGERYPDVPSLLAGIHEALSGVVAPPPGAAMLDLVDVDVEAMENPFKGLRAFGEADEEDFFGREALIQSLLTRLAEENDLSRFLAVVGPSGSGKSSAVKGGLIPAIRRGGLPGSDSWFVVDFMPGAHPLEELEAALLRVAVNPPGILLEQLRGSARGLLRTVRSILPKDECVELVLVIDQFEEVFTLVEDEEVRAHFLEGLVTAVLDPHTRLRLVITLRADFTDRPLQYVDFGELVRQRAEFVLPLTPDELELAIVGPAKRVGLIPEPELVNRILRDLGDQPGTLPLLQYTLTELFERRDGRALTLAAYEESGGALGTLGRRADEIYTSLDEKGRRAARQLFLRLITLGEGVEYSRRRVLRSELLGLEIPAVSGMSQAGSTSRPWKNEISPTGAGGELFRPDDVMAAIIELFGQARLLTFDHDSLTRGQTVEVAHEALFREWRRLRDWLDESCESLRVHRRLAATASEWSQAGRDPGFLLRGSRLDQFETWSASADLSLTREERDYLDTSLAERQDRQATEMERQARKAALEHRSRNFLRALVVVLSLATVFALVLTGFAFWQRRQALEAHSLSLAAHAQRALSDLNNSAALPLALAASDLNDPPDEVVFTLRNAAYAPGARKRYIMRDEVGEVAPIQSVAVSPDGDAALVGLANGNALLLDMNSGETLRTFAGFGYYIWSVAFSPDGKTALTGGCGGWRIVLWNVATGKKIRHFSGHSGCVNAVAFSPDGKRAISGGESSNGRGDLILWDVKTGEKIRDFERHTNPVFTAAFSPDGRSLVSGSDVDASTIEYDNPVILWDVESGEIIQRFEHPNTSVIKVAFSRDGRSMLTAAGDHNIYLWDIQTGEQLRVYKGHRDIVIDISVSPDGRRAISSDVIGELIMWDLESGEPLARFAQTEQAVVTFHPDGREAVSGSLDGSLVIWDLFGAKAVRRFEGYTGRITDVEFTPDGRYLLSAASVMPDADISASDYTLRLWEVETGKQMRILEGHTDTPGALDISPDGSKALSVSIDGSMRLWDLESGAELQRFEHAGMWDVAFHPDGRRALTTGTEPSMLVLWDLETGEILHRYFGHGDETITVAISPDGERALSGAADGEMILWDLESRRHIHRFEDDLPIMHPVTCVEFSPDGNLAVAGLGSEGIMVWDLESGEALRYFDRHQAIVGINGLDVSADGRTVISASVDGEVFVWDLETGRILHHFKGHDNFRTTAVAFSSDGYFGISSSQNHTLYLWRLATPTLDELYAWIETHRYVRALTCEERSQYRIEPLCEE